MSRSCARPACGDSAAATLGYDYRARTAVVEPLAPERHPMSYDLCDHHAEGLTVPNGWVLDDRRRRFEVVRDRLAS